MWVEPKTFGFGIHTRVATRRDAADAPAMPPTGSCRSDAPHWRRRTGHNIVEYSFRHEGKDSAIAALRERTGATAVLFAGDDVTDEDALASLGAERPRHPRRATADDGGDRCVREASPNLAAALLGAAGAPDARPAARE